MHTYATNSPFQPRLIAMLAFVAIGVTVAIGWLTSWIRGTWGYEIGGVSSMAVFGALYFAFDRYVWRCRIARTLLLVPNLNGIWKCSGTTTFRDGESVNDDWPADVRITQSWSRISLVLKTEKSTSRSIAASLYHQPGEGYRLIYHFENVPKADQPELHRHAGLCDLLFADDLAHAEGNYVTDLGRRTIGTMTLMKRRSQI